MVFESVDKLQKTLAANVFKYATDQKKAAGRALGMLIEIVTFYMLFVWKHRDNIVIERSIPEYANSEILHNVEFSLHPVQTQQKLTIDPVSLPLTTAKILHYSPSLKRGVIKPKTTQVVSSNLIKRNAAVLVSNETSLIVANVDSIDSKRCKLTICELSTNPYAIFECKRVGVEEGMRKGPQTIEKAKQGAYVSRSVSSLQKIRLRNGKWQGFIEMPDGTLKDGLYDELLKEIINAPSDKELNGFILTVGVVSNHGNWFTNEDHNKELRVLAQSYDWLLFLTDNGLSNFIDKLLLNPPSYLMPACKAFRESYSSGSRSGGNRFTKVRIDIDADRALINYFIDNQAEIETWFNVISPHNGTLEGLKSDLHKLSTKNG